MIPYKTWLHEEAHRYRVKPITIISRITRGEYGEVKKFRHAKQLWLEHEPIHRPNLSRLTRKSEAQKETLTFGRWAAEQAIKENVGVGCIFMRFYRGKYPDLERVVVSPRRIYIKEKQTKEHTA